jgi:hypothetical protein
MYLKTEAVVLPHLILSVYIPTRIIGDHSTFMVNHNFKVSPSARCVYNASAFYKDNKIFNNDYISLTDLL